MEASNGIEPYFLSGRGGVRGKVPDCPFPPLQEVSTNPVRLGLAKLLQELPVGSVQLDIPFSRGPDRQAAEFLH
jgi:hypothetical protein